MMRKEKGESTREGLVGGGRYADDLLAGLAGCALRVCVSSCSWSLGHTPVTTKAARSAGSNQYNSGFD